MLMIMMMWRSGGGGGGGGGGNRIVFAHLQTNFIKYHFTHLKMSPTKYRSFCPDFNVLENGCHSTTLVIWHDIPIMSACIVWEDNQPISARNHRRRKAANYLTCLVLGNNYFGYTWVYVCFCIDGLMQKRCNSRALGFELRLLCIKVAVKLHIFSIKSLIWFVNCGTLKQ